MKKVVSLCIALIACLSVFAQVSEFKNAYVWGQSNRNSSQKGSALSTKNGMTYSLANVLKKADPKDIDIMCYFGKIGKTAPALYLFAPMEPGVDVVWEKQGGTRPFCLFEGPKDNADGPMALKNWTVRNATKFKKVAAEDYDKANFAALKFDNNEYKVAIATDDVIAFETAAGKRGFIKVGAIEDDPEKADQAGNGQYQKVNLSIKVQK